MHTGDPAPSTTPKTSWLKMMIAPEDLALVTEASDLIALSVSTFVRSTAVERAREILATHGSKAK